MTQTNPGQAEVLTAGPPGAQGGPAAPGVVAPKGSRRALHRRGGQAVGGEAVLYDLGQPPSPSRRRRPTPAPLGRRLLRATLHPLAVAAAVLCAIYGVTSWYSARPVDMIQPVLEAAPRPSVSPSPSSSPSPASRVLAAAAGQRASGTPTRRASSRTPGKAPGTSSRTARRATVTATPSPAATTATTAGPSAPSTPTTEASGTGPDQSVLAASGPLPSTPATDGGGAGSTQPTASPTAPAATQSSTTQPATQPTAPPSSAPPTTTQTTTQTSTQSTTQSAPPSTTESAPAGPPAPSTDQPVNVQRAFYVDCSAGHDSGGGRSTSDAWQTLGKVASAGLQPGDGVYLKRGCAWDGGLWLKSSGTSGNPILLSAYGSGAAPVVSNTGGDTYASSIVIEANYVVVENLALRNAHFAGVRFWDGTAHNIVRDSEVDNTGLGVVLGGSYHLATRNTVHDLHMVNNTPGGQDDYGAVGFTINGTDDEVSYNRCTNCQSSSYDFGTDGGFVEVWNSGDRASIHHNIARSTNGFFELGASDSSHHANDVMVDYNVIDNAGISINVNRNNAFGISVNNFRFENNTVVQTQKGFPAVIFPSVTPSAFISRNNIYYLASNGLVAWYGSGSFTHENNVYQLSNGAYAGFSLNGSERQADPKFANLGGGDYHLTSGSPAIGAGTNLGLSTDFDGKAVGSGAPAAGAYQP